jgi:hypothetical protein
MTAKNKTKAHALVEIRTPVFVRLDLLPSGIRTSRISFLEGALKGRDLGKFWLTARDLKSVCVYLRPVQLKKLVARLEALKLPGKPRRR